MKRFNCKGSNINYYLLKIIIFVINNKFIYYIFLSVTYYLLILYISSPIYCMDSDSDLDPKIVEKDSKYEKYSKEELRGDVGLASKIAYDTSIGVTIMAGTAAATSALKGDSITAGIYTGVAVGGIITAGISEIIKNESNKSIDKIDDDYPTDEPPSPSVYDPDVIKNLKSSLMPDLTYIIEYFNSLDNEHKLICYIIAYLLLAFYLYILIIIKNKINEKTNKLKPKTENKIINTIFRIKDISNKNINIIIKIFIVIILSLAILTSLYVIFWFR